MTEGRIHPDGSPNPDGVEYGTVPGYSRYFVGDDGSVWSWKVGKGKYVKRKPISHGKNAVQTSLSKNGGKISIAISRLVLWVFGGNNDPILEAHHNNRDKSDNRLCNLRWDTQSGSEEYMRSHGIPFVSRERKSGFSRGLVSDVRNLKSGGMSCRAIAKKLGIGDSTVSKMAREDTLGFEIASKKSSRVHPDGSDNCDGVEYGTVEGFPAYFIGDDGSAWSRSRYGGIARGGRGYKNKWKRLRGEVCSGYRSVCLRGNGKELLIGIHRLVLWVFTGRLPNNMYACHNNGDPLDNRLENLRWDTNSGNMADKEKHGTVVRGEDHYNAKLTTKSVIEILERAKMERHCDLAKEYGVSSSTIGLVIKKRIWKHV